MGLWSLEVQSDVYRRQIMTTKVDPRAVRVNPYAAGAVYMRFQENFKPS